jgi:enoyl-CoA hydratase/carnithine racemase
MSESVRINKDGHVAIVTLNRPQKHNAINLDMFAALASAGMQLGKDSSVRAIVVEGAGPSFCAGIDLSIFEQADSSMLISKMAPAEDSAANLFQRAAFVWREVPQPVICALHGSVFGGGLQIALGADLRFGSADSRYSVMEIKWGLIPDMAISTTLARLVPTDRAKELAWSGRVFDAVEARDMGVITALHDNPSQAARDAAASIANRSPKAVRAIKRLFDESAEMSVGQALQLEAELQLSLLGGDQQIEAVAANLEKRAPKFED